MNTKREIDLAVARVLRKHPWSRFEEAEAFTMGQAVGIFQGAGASGEVAVLISEVLSLGIMVCAAAAMDGGAEVCG